MRRQSKDVVHVLHTTFTLLAFTVNWMDINHSEASFPVYLY